MSKNSKNVLAFNIPFSGFTETTFINCFTSVFMFLEQIAIGKSDYECRQMKGNTCNSCGNCANGGLTPIALQEKYFFLFDTMCGRSALRCRFDGEPTEMDRMIGESNCYDGDTDNNIDFLFGFASYSYRKITDGTVFNAEIIAAIDAGKPVLAKVKTRPGGCRVVIGYDGGKLVEPDYINAQRPPKKASRYEDLTALYVIDKKTEPRYWLKDGLDRILKVMEFNQEEKLWDKYIEKMGLYTADSLQKVDINEKKARMKRVADTMWHTFNCHNFAEVFRQYRDGGNPAAYDAIGDMKKLHTPGCRELWDTISGPCHGYTHDLAWALIGLEACADWTKHAAGYFGEMIELTLSQIKSNDAAALDALRRAYAILYNDER